VKINLEGKVAVVSGSTAGIGLAIAAGLAESGAMTVVNGRTAEAVENAIETIRLQHASAELVGVVADLSGPEG
jgi:NAD(P)-dependent dehydrogenase (short-subunit alcohol dehydrogenase family)